MYLYYLEILLVLICLQNLYPYLFISIGDLYTFKLQIDLFNFNIVGHTLFVGHHSSKGGVGGICQNGCLQRSLRGEVLVERICDLSGLKNV